MSDVIYEKLKKFGEYKQSILSGGGRHCGATEYYKLCERQYLLYEDYKNRLFKVLNKKIAEKIIKIIRTEFDSIYSKNEAMEEVINAMYDGADLSEVETFIDIQFQHVKALLKPKFKQIDYINSLKNHAETTGLEKYSTTQLKAELRRRKEK